MLNWLRVWIYDDNDKVVEATVAMEYMQKAAGWEVIARHMIHIINTSTDDTSRTIARALHPDLFEED